MPTLDQLDAAMLHPGRFVPAIKQMGGGRVSTAEDGRPWRLVGNDAAVYQLTKPDGTVLALRCPFEDTFAAAGADVYAVLARGGGAAVHPVSDLLARPVAVKAEGLLVPRDDFRSDSRGLIVMEWIDGATLGEAVEQACSRDDRQALEALAVGWDSAVQRIQAAAFVHGDLSDQNVLVDPVGRMRLVDLDTCSWPGSPRPAMLFGTPGYVHPRANTKTTGANRDAFAALVMSVSLWILAVAPWLRQNHRQPGPPSGALLFSAWDLAHAGNSPTFADVRAAAPAALLGAVEALLHACEGSPNDVLAHVQRPSSLSPSPDRTTEARPRSDLVGSDEVRHRDVERFQERWAHHQESPASIGDDGRANLRRWKEDVQRLQVALAAGDEDLVARLWPHVRGDAILSARSIEIADIVQRRHGAVIAAALREGKDQQLVDGVGAAEAAGVAVTASTRRAMRQARRRIGLRERSRFATEGNDSGLLAELGGSLEAGELEGIEERANITHSMRQAAQRSRLQRALRLDDDAGIVAAWDPTILSDDPRLSGEARQRIDLALRRRRWIEGVRAALKSRNVSQLRDLVADAPPDALSRLSAVERRRIGRAIERASASANLQTALETGSRAGILDAMNRLMASGATLPASLDWRKVRDVADRESLVRAIRDATQGDRPDYERLALLLPAARTAAADSPFLEDDINVEALERVVLREDYLRRLRAAMAASDDGAIAAAAGPDPFGALNSLTPEERAHINAVLRRLGRRQIG